MIPLTVTWDGIGGLVDAHERFLAGSLVESDVRDSVLDSWKRCRSVGLEPHRLVVRYTEDVALDDRLLRAVDPVLKDLAASLTDVGMTIALCDGQGRMVQRLGGGRQLCERLDEVRFAPGFDASEAVVGTNGVGTALAERGPVYVAGREHFADCLQPFACAGAPVRDPLSGRIEAVLDLTCLRDQGDPAMVRMVRDAARDIEARLLEQASQRERALLAAYRRADGHARGWPKQPEGPAFGHAVDSLGRIDLAVLRERAEELIASPRRPFAEVTLPSGRTATLLRRQVRGAAGEVGVAVEARVLGGPRLRHVRPAPSALQALVASDVPSTLGSAVQAGTAGRVGPPTAGEPAPPVPQSATAPPATTRTVVPAPAGLPPSAPNTDGSGSGVMRTVVSPSQPPPIRPAPDGGGDKGGAAPTLVPAPQPATTQPEFDGDGGGAEGWLLLVGEPGVGRLAMLARRRLELLHDASVRIGTTLDVTRTAEELAEVTVPRFADFVAVDLPDSVLRGEEPEALGGETALRRVAIRAARKEPHNLYDVGDLVEYVPSTPQARCLETRQSVLEPVLAAAGGWIAQDPARLERVLAAGIHSLITVPLRARGTTLGVVSFYRSLQPAAFEDDDLSLAQELSGRAAICIDNARRYTREHNTALTLQRSLLPRGRSEQSAVEVAYRYLPAQAGVGGDWFDVIPLSGARVALVVGDVVGHGLYAAATMGRLRTAVHNFCALDLPPDDLLTHLDDLVGRLDRGEGWAAENTPDSGIVGATCLYAVYDPVSRRCTLTRAGHPQPAVVAPDGTVEFVDLPSCPPLGLGGTPFETIELELAEGSQLVLYTDGLIEDRHRDIDAGMDQLRTVLARVGRRPEETCEAVLDALLPARPSDDIALLVARTHTLGADRVAQWDLPSDPAVVSRARTAVTDQLAAWGLDDLSFSTELIASELVTNVIRHATGPVQLRLLRDRALICEVSDGSSTSPRLRRARSTDEGGRGLFLVAQLTERWGTRYTPDGKVIWTEQPLP
ncbi:SpoIIE family protein phosphatase [Streptomyces regalis]|uniref:Protein phosphatase n=1 Tax=Streptomyces regalis TaxID=68262 RepID=A0A117MR09_9ACTN|nr:SpoIIE family protein phosphatase [Streptomyces regalis]KUL31074.1 protein phosphatase [Streptomyces regalis]